MTGILFSKERAISERTGFFIAIPGCACATAAALVFCLAAGCDSGGPAADAYPLLVCSSSDTP